MPFLFLGNPYNQVHQQVIYLATRVPCYSLLEISWYFTPAQYAVDRIKRVVPIWKREVFEDGSVWVGSQCEADHGLVPESHALRS